jgi:glycosyltransferase involved in cell wall biosynthesis
MTISLAYVLHSGQLFGTERMALATLIALRDSCDSHDGLIIAPPGPVHAAARLAGLRSRVAHGRAGMVWNLLCHLLQHRHSAVFTTGVWQALAGRALQRLCGGRGAHVHVVHGGTEERLSYSRKRWLAGLRVRQVAVSAFVRSRLLAHGVPATCIEVVHNFLPPTPSAQRAVFTVDGVRRVVMLSRLDRIKRVGLLFDALERTPGLGILQFDIYGSGEEAALLKARARRHSNVTLHGFVPDAAAALAGADLLLHTCPEEPFGLVLLEAFAAGVPVLVPNSGGAGEIVQEGVNGWRFSANNAAALGQRLQALACVPAVQLNAMAAGGRASLQQTFAPARQAVRYADLAREAT